MTKQGAGLCPLDDLVYERGGAAEEIRNVLAVAPAIYCTRVLRNALLVCSDKLRFRSRCRKQARHRIATEARCDYAGHGARTRSRQRRRSVCLPASIIGRGTAIKLVDCGSEVGTERNRRLVR